MLVEGESDGLRQRGAKRVGVGSLPHEMAGDQVPHALLGCVNDSARMLGLRR